MLSKTANKALINKKVKKARRRLRRKQKLSAVTHFSPFPDVMDVAIKYSTRIQYNSASFNVYNANMSSLQTFQGFYRDQLLALYKNYVVLGFTVNYKIINTDVSGVSGEFITFDAPSSEVAGITFANLLEYPGNKKQLLASIGNKFVITSTKHYSLPAVYKKDISVDSDFWGTSAAGPTWSDCQEHCLGVYSLNGTSTVSAMIDREYVFHTRFFRRENPGNSVVVGDLKPSFPEKKKPARSVKKVVVSDSD